MSEQPTSDSIQSKSIAVAVAPSISRFLGVVPILPGESADLYQASLDTLIEELGARSVLQVYLAEKIHECLWWMRRYEVQKRTIVTTEMASLLNYGYSRQTRIEAAQTRNTCAAILPDHPSRTTVCKNCPMVVLPCVSSKRGEMARPISCSRRTS